MVTRAATEERLSPWLPAGERERAREQKIEAVQDMALSMFIEQGYHHVTMVDVAKRLHVTKPALYNYFSSKEELLYSCWMAGYERLQKRIADEVPFGKTALAALRALIRIYAETMTTSYGKSLVLLDDRDMDEKSRRIIRDGKRELDGIFRDLIARGIADGSVVTNDVKMTAFAITGALNWIGHWYKPDGPMTPEAIGADFAMRLSAALPGSGAGPG